METVITTVRRDKSDHDDDDNDDGNDDGNDDDVLCLVFPRLVGSIGRLFIIYEYFDVIVWNSLILIVLMTSNSFVRPCIFT